MRPVPSLLLVDDAHDLCAAGVCHDALEDPSHIRVKQPPPLPLQINPTAARSHQMKPGRPESYVDTFCRGRAGTNEPWLHPSICTARQHRGGGLGATHGWPLLTQCGCRDQKGSGWKAVIRWWRSTQKFSVGVWQGP